MILHRVLLCSIALGQVVALVSQIAERNTGLQEAHVFLNVIVGDAIEITLLGRGLALAEDPRARNVDAIAVRSDEIRVEGEDIPLLDQTRSAFLKPRVRSRSRRHDARLDPLSAASNVFGLQDSPQVVLRNPRMHRGAHDLDAPLARLHTAPHRLDFVLVLHQTREL